MSTTITARDGWRFEYNTAAMPGYIKVYNAEGVRQTVTSGQLGAALVKRRLRRFLDLHHRRPEQEVKR